MATRSVLCCSLSSYVTEIILFINIWILFPLQVLLVLPKYFSSCLCYIVQNHSSDKQMGRKKSRNSISSQFIYHFLSQHCSHCLTVLFFIFVMVRDFLLISLLGKVKLSLAFGRSHLLTCFSRSYSFLCDLSFFLSCVSAFLCCILLRVLSNQKM